MQGVIWVQGAGLSSCELPCQNSLGWVEQDCEWCLERQVEQIVNGVGIWKHCRDARYLASVQSGGGDARRSECVSLLVSCCQ